MKSIGALQVTTPTDREIVVTRAFEAPRDLVFDAYTTPELVKRWLTGPPGWTLAICEIDLRVGGAYRYVWQGPDGSSMGMGGNYREIVRPERLVTTESFDQDWTGGETLGTIVLTEKGGKTMLTQTIRYSSQAARDGALQTPMAEGMAYGYDRLAELLASLPVHGG